MCYHNSINKDSKSIEKKYKAVFPADVIFEPIFHGNGFDFLKWPVIINPNEKKIKMMHWGLVPSWVKSMEDAKKIRAFNLNAKSETVFEKPSFKAAIHSRRCIIPSTGFFEWKTLNKKKYPYFIFPAEGGFFSLAGIYEQWADSETGELVNTFSILTTVANPLMAEIHNDKKRMPMILPEQEQENWLEGSINKAEINQLLKPFDEKLMLAYPVSKLISTRGVNSNVPEVSKRREDFPKGLFV
ncbi:MAG: SOS response-associated peptidase [Bacteroidetes bacterium]|nr:SOS response-associated peptidase [Bacteroidota bacterium]